MTRALCPWAALTAGIPLTLLLDLAVGEALDSATILGEEQAHALANTAWAEVASARAERGSSGGGARGWPPGARSAPIRGLPRRPPAGTPSAPPVHATGARRAPTR